MPHRSIRDTAYKAVSTATGLPTPASGQALTVATNMTNEELDKRLRGIEGQPAPAKGDTGATGPQGNTGPQGDTGAAGGRGSSGTKGDAGVAGDQGLKGDTGATGAQGPKGDAGATGAAGPQGIAGATGPAGAPGTAGAKGDTGAQGPQGATGAKGDTGATGLQGATGTTGATGATGAQGVAGPTGATGLTGAVGAQGATGATGAAGADLTNPKIRTKRMATPAALIGATMTISVVWDIPFADANYTFTGVNLIGPSFLGLRPNVTAFTKDGCTVQVQNTLGLALVAAAGGLHISAIHD